MLPLNKLRPSPNKGRYLFYNPLLWWSISAIDQLLNVILHPSTEQLSIKPSKILVCCQAHIGDALLATSVLPVLIAAFPHADIGFLTSTAAVEVLSDNPRISRVHLFDHWRLNRTKSSLWQKICHDVRNRIQIIDELKKIDYDLVIDLYPYFPNSIPILYFAKIPYRIGWTSAGMAGLLTHAIDWTDSDEHVVEWYKRLLRKIPACEPYLHLLATELYSSELIRSEWQSIVSKYNIQKSFMVYHVGSGGIHRRWPTEYWYKLAELCINSGAFILLLGHGEEEIAICKEISKLSNNICDLSGKLSWRLMTECIGQSKLLVGLESASGHIAAARNVKSISVYSGTTRTTAWRPYHAKARVFVHDVPCYPCFKSTGCEGMECVRLTLPELVYAEIKTTDIF